MLSISRRDFQCFRRLDYATPLISLRGTGVSSEVWIIISVYSFRPEQSLMFQHRPCSFIAQRGLRQLGLLMQYNSEESRKSHAKFTLGPVLVAAQNRNVEGNPFSLRENAFHLRHSDNYLWKLAFVTEKATTLLLNVTSHYFDAELLTRFMLPHYSRVHTEIIARLAQFVASLRVSVGHKWDPGVGRRPYRR